METDLGIELREFHEIDVKEWEIEKIEQVSELIAQLNELELMAAEITLIAGDFQDAREAVNLAAWEGARLLEERTLFRKRASALIQGYRTRDAAFRIFRSERLERYKSFSIWRPPTPIWQPKPLITKPGSWGRRRVPPSSSASLPQGLWVW